MNKKGFTIVELLAVVVIIAILAGLAVPNILRMIDTSKKEKFITDAKQVIAKAKYYRKDTESTGIGLDKLEVNLGDSPYGGTYDGKVTITSGNISLCLTDGQYGVKAENINFENETVLTVEQGEKCGLTIPEETID